MMQDLQCQPAQFNDRIIEEKGNTQRCDYNSKTNANHARRFPGRRNDGEFFRITRYFVPPVPLRKESYEAKEVEEVYSLQR